MGEKWRRGASRSARGEAVRVSEPSTLHGPPTRCPTSCRLPLHTSALRSGPPPSMARGASVHAPSAPMCSRVPQQGPFSPKVPDARAPNTGTRTGRKPGDGDICGKAA